MLRYRKYLRATLLIVSLLLAVLVLIPGQARAAGGAYHQINLVSDLPNLAPTLDANLVNPWGLARSSTSPWWVSDNGMGVSTLYHGDGSIVPLVVTIPPPMGSPLGTTAAPTGDVFNTFLATNPSAFVVSENGKSAPSTFIFSTEDGTISGWSPNVDRLNAILGVDRSMDNAVYKGLAIGQVGDTPYLFATNFHSGRVEQFDWNFKLVRTFTDPDLASNCPLPGQCYAPFGIQNIQGRLYVTFALQDEAKHDDQSGPGNGFVDVFNTSGRLLRRFASHGALNSPWGLALAPSDFGTFSNALLVGNFGDGRINAYDLETGQFMGGLHDSQGESISIDSLWALGFGNDQAAGMHNELFFTAGFDHEAHGLFGKIVVDISKRKTH